VNAAMGALRENTDDMYALALGLLEATVGTLMV